jgi:hypothetical protein
MGELAFAGAHILPALVGRSDERVDPAEEQTRGEPAERPAWTRGKPVCQPGRRHEQSGPGLSQRSSRERGILRCVLGGGCWERAPGCVVWVRHVLAVDHAAGGDPRRLGRMGPHGRTKATLLTTALSTVVRVVRDQAAASPTSSVILIRTLRPYVSLAPSSFQGNRSIHR